MNIPDKRRECAAALPKGWQKEDVIRKTSLSTGKVDVFYYSSSLHLCKQSMQHDALKRKLARSATSICNSPSSKHHTNYSRADTSLVPPIRQTASIFKQPVTVHRNQEPDGNVKKDLKHGTQDKPKQLFWEKRLEGLRACDTDGSEIGDIELPKRLRAVGPNISEGTLLQSIATSLHISAHPVTGQSASKPVLSTNTAVFLNPEQPLMQMITISEDDIKRQEERVQFARHKLQEALKA